MRALALAILLACFGSFAAAQTPDPAGQGRDRYQARLAELAEALGGAHYLRTLCAGLQDQRWREQMRRVIGQEAQAGWALAEAFNRGYREDEARFPRCDAAAARAEEARRAAGARAADALKAVNTGLDEPR